MMLSMASVSIEIHRDSEGALLDALNRAMADREIDPRACLGYCGWQSDGGYPDSPDGGAKWMFNERYPKWMAVIWHPDAIVPPGLVVTPAGIIYGRVGHSHVVRHQDSSA